jgi:hypothetical protein
MAEPDFRALCERLLKSAEDYVAWKTGGMGNAIAEARAALAQPAPEPPTDEKLENTYNRAVSNYLCSIKANRTLVDDDLAESRFAGLRAVYNRGRGDG